MHNEGVVITNLMTTRKHISKTNKYDKEREYVRHQIFKRKSRGSKTKHKK